MLGWFAVEFIATEMIISISKSDAMVLSWIPILGLGRVVVPKGGVHVSQGLVHEQ